MLSIRLIGTPAEVAEVALALRDAYGITAVSGLRPSRRNPAHVCLYLEVNGEQQ